MTTASLTFGALNILVTIIYHIYHKSFKYMILYLWDLEHEPNLAIQG